MFAMGVLTTTRRVEAPDGLDVGRPGHGGRRAARAWPSCWPPAPSRPQGIAIIPIAGIIVGNAMTAHTLVGRRAFAALREEHSAVRGVPLAGAAAPSRRSARSSTAARPRPCCPGSTR